MKANMGTADKVLRILVAILIGVLYFIGQITGTVAIILMALAIIFIATSFMSFCPMYLPFGISTKKNKAKN
jgi:hypothetical protein